MKASTLFALTIAGLLALGTVVVSKQLGLFQTQPRVETKNEPIQILVAGDNLFEGITLTGGMVKVRSLRPGELAHYQSNKEKYLPPLIQAANLRVPIRNISADTPLLADDLQDLAFAEALSARLGKDMRAVNVDVPKLRAAGGLIKMGDRVDVLLTTSICADSTCANPLTQTGYIAHGLKVVAKRNIPWNVLAPLPEGPLSFTLEANPYRAALLELAMTKGNLTLVPNPSGASASKVSFASLDSTEYRDEDQRVNSIMKGELVVNDSDLERIFKLRPMIRPDNSPPPYRIQHMSGINPVGEMVFDRTTGTMISRNNYLDSNGRPISTVAKAPELTVQTGTPSLGYRFMAPAGSDVMSAAPRKA